MNNFPYELYPHELCIGDVYFSPVLLVLLLAFMASALTSLLFNKTKLSALLIHSALSFIAMMVLYVVFIDHFFIKI